MKILAMAKTVFSAPVIALRYIPAMNKRTYFKNPLTDAIIAKDRAFWIGYGISLFIIFGIIVWAVQ